MRNLFLLVVVLTARTLVAANVIEFGAVADGKTDSTSAFQRAIDSLAETGGEVEVPAGRFIVGELTLRRGVTVRGTAGYGFRSCDRGTVLVLRKDETSRTMFDLTGAVGASLRDLAMIGDLPMSVFPPNTIPSRIVHGVALMKTDYGKEEDYPLIDHCCIRNFSGDGILFEKVWCGNVRNSLIIGNGGDGVRIRGWDVFVIDNEICGCGGYGIHGVNPNNACTITANRIEWSRSGGLFLERGSHYCINANYFDRSGTAAVIFDGVHHTAFTGNQLYRSGRPEWARAEMPYSAHAVLRNCRGLTFSSNNLVLGKDDNGQGSLSPQDGIVMTNLVNSAVIGNTGDGAVLHRFLVDLGGHDNTVIRDNPGTPARLR